MIVNLLSVEGLPPLKGIVYGLVSVPLQKSVVVLDIACGEVAVVSTREFSGSSNYLTLLNTLKSRRFLFSVSKEFIANESVIDKIIASCTQQISEHIPVITEDNKFIVVYDDLVARAFELQASDIHFEITNTAFSRVRLRIFGRLKDWKTLSTELLKGSLTAAYSKRTKSGTNSSGALSLERAMNTTTEQTVHGKTVNGRFAGYPLVNGYDVVMRLLDSDIKSVIPTIEDLGYSAFHAGQQIIPAIHRNAGMMVIAGSTGSGKSTALRSFIHALPERDSLKIYGVEDPVEYLNPFMRQISIQRNSDDADDVVKMKFLSALRSVLRMDPDVLMLGEIRDAESASLASEFNRTGHRVFTTVHGDGCVDVLARLVSDEIGIHASTLAAKKFLSAVMYQKLLPKLCAACRLPAVNHLSVKTQDLLRRKYSVDPKTMFVANEHGCIHCKVAELGLAGTKGLTVVAEILTPTDDILEAIKEQSWSVVENLWRGTRRVGFDLPDMLGKTAFEHALFKACQGLIDPRDIEADFESFETYSVHSAKPNLQVLRG